MRTRSTGFRSQLILYDVLFAELMLFPNKVALLVNFLPLQLRTLKNSLTGSGLLWLLVSEAEAQAYCSGPAKACSRGAWSSQPRTAEVSRRGWPWTFSIAVDGVYIVNGWYSTPFMGIIETHNKHPAWWLRSTWARYLKVTADRAEQMSQRLCLWHFLHHSSRWQCRKWPLQLISGSSPGRPAPPGRRFVMYFCYLY